MECCREKVATGAAASVGCAKVGSIRMYVEDHVRSSVGNFSIRMRGHVINELVDTITCLFSGFTLLGGNGQERYEDCRIDGAGIVEEAANNLLDALFAGFVEFGTCVAWKCFLIVLAIFDWIRAVGAMLGFVWMWMSVAEQLFGDVCCH